LFVRQDYRPKAFSHIYGGVYWQRSKASKTTQLGISYGNIGHYTPPWHGRR